MIKLKNKLKDIRQFTDNGQIIEVGPGKIVEAVKPIFDENAFEVVDIKNRKIEKLEEKTSTKEVK